MWNPIALAAFAALKAAADPASVFNAGCKIARDGDAPFAALRHDPEATPIDARARVALDRIERTRAWHTYRLDAAGVADC